MKLNIKTKQRSPEMKKAVKAYEDKERQNDTLCPWDTVSGGLRSSQ